MKETSELKQKFNQLATKKLNYEKIIIFLDKTISEINEGKCNNKSGKGKNQKDTMKISFYKENERLIKRICTLKDKSDVNKLIIIKIQITEELLQLKKEYNKYAELLYKKCDIIFECKNDLDDCEKSKNKIKQEMQEYIFEVENKHLSLIETLSEKLKLSEIYKKTYKF